MEDTRAEALPIGAAEAAAALQTLQRYKAGKAALDKRLIDNELYDGSSCSGGSCCKGFRF